MTYEITGGNEDGAFAIDATTGQITVNTDDPALLNFEVRPTRSINVTATDNNKDGPRSTVKTILITLTDCEDAPVVTDTTFSVDENAPSGTTVGSVIATDEDRDDVPLTYQIMAGSDGVFSIDANTGTVRVSGKINYEIKSLYVLTIRVTGGQGIYGEGKMTVQVNDVNDAPVLPTNVVLSLPENTIVNSPIGGPITATDEDRPRQQLTYSIVSGSDGFIGITAENGQLMLIKKVTFSEKQVFTLVVRVIDNGVPPLQATTTVTINVHDTNDAPVWVAPFTRSVDENSPVNTPVGAPAQAIEPDTSDIISYKIQANEGPFAINPSTGQITVKIAELNYERQDQYTILLRASDQHGMFTDQLFTININDVNDPPVFRDQVRRIDENSAVDTRVGDPLVATDDDQPTVLVFSIASGNTANAFKFGSNGQLLVASRSALDYETRPKFTLVVVVSDGIASVNATVTVFLNDVNDPPICSARTLSVNENSPIGTRVGTPVTCVDPDVGDSVHYRLASSSTVFNLDGTAQVTLLTGSLDYEDPSMRQYVLNALAVDNSLAETQYTITINVLDVNEAPEWKGSDQFTVDVNAQVNDLLSPAKLLFVDPDTEQQQVLHYRIDNINSADPSDASNFFSVDKDSGEVRVKQAGLESASVPTQFTMRVIATDDGSPTGQTTQAITITVDGKNIPPVCQDIVLSVQENSRNKVIGNVACVDPENQVLKYTMVPANPATAADAFDLEVAGAGASNVIVNRATLDYERQNQYVYTLTVWEELEPTNTASSTLTINVEDVNEPPVITTSTLYAVVGLRGGNPVGTIEVNDPERTRVELRITRGNEDGVFAFASQYSRQLIVAHGRTIPGSPARYPMNVEAKDAGGLTYDRVVTVQLCQLPEDTGSLPMCPENVSRNSASSDDDSSSSDAATIIVAVVLVLLCVVLVVLIVLARRNQNANTQARERASAARRGGMCGMEARLTGVVRARPGRCTR